MIPDQNNFNIFIHFEFYTYYSFTLLLLVCTKCSEKFAQKVALSDDHLSIEIDLIYNFKTMTFSLKLLRHNLKKNFYLSKATIFYNFVLIWFHIFYLPLVAMVKNVPGTEKICGPITQYCVFYITFIQPCYQFTPTYHRSKTPKICNHQSSISTDMFQDTF